MDVDRLLKLLYLDIKLALLGLQIFVLKKEKQAALAVYLIFLAGSLFAIYLLLTRGMSSLKSVMGIQAIFGLPLIVFMIHLAKKTS